MGFKRKKDVLKWTWHAKTLVTVARKNGTPVADNAFSGRHKFTIIFYLTRASISWRPVPLAIITESLDAFKGKKNILVYGLILVTGLTLGHYIPQLVRMLTPDYSEGNFSAYYPDANVQVVLYGTETCPYCVQARKYLRERQIAFVDFDINNSEKGRRDFSALGGKGVPLILIGNRQVSGFNQASIDAALGKIKSEAR